MRHGVPIAGNFLQQELAIVTGAVDGIGFWDPSVAGYAMNKVAQMVLDGEEVTDGMDLGLTGGDDEGESLNLREVRQIAESKAIRVALTKSYGNISKAAELLGITRPTLYDLLNKYGLSAESYSKKAAP